MEERDEEGGQDVERQGERGEQGQEVSAHASSVSVPAVLVRTRGQRPHVHAAAARPMLSPGARRSASHCTCPAPALRILALQGLHFLHSLQQCASAIIADHGLCHGRQRRSEMKGSTSVTHASASAIASSAPHTSQMLSAGRGKTRPWSMAREVSLTEARPLRMATWNTSRS